MLLHDDSAIGHHEPLALLLHLLLLLLLLSLCLVLMLWLWLLRGLQEYFIIQLKFNLPALS